MESKTQSGIAENMEWKNGGQRGTEAAGANSIRESGPLPSIAALSVLGQNTHKTPPSTQEISDERKEQQTKSGEKNKPAKHVRGQRGIMLQNGMGLDKARVRIAKHNMIKFRAKV